MHADKEQAKTPEIEETGNATGSSQQGAAPALQLGIAQGHVEGSSDAANSLTSSAARPGRSNRGSKAPHIHVLSLAQPSNHVNVGADCSLGIAKRSSTFQHAIQLGAAATSIAEQRFPRRASVDNAQVCPFPYFATCGLLPLTKRGHPFCSLPGSLLACGQMLLPLPVHSLGVCAQKSVLTSTCSVNFQHITVLMAKWNALLTEKCSNGILHHCASLCLSTSAVADLHHRVLQAAQNGVC